VEVELKNSEDFLKVRETLSRIGLASKKEKTLYQSCHILHKQGKYYIVHFKELYALDGRDRGMTNMDIQRRNTIADYLEEWGLVEIVNPEILDVDFDYEYSAIKIIPYKDKQSWELLPKYNIGKVKTNGNDK
jgi:hypothetical protein